ncbi:hypothetical protein [Haemophilus parahaemolyticus]|uniref:hypothetical protein n=1 Tax=Haemophilus parahaemolyticus TaxID=735 RepID=UPI002912BF8C|nr:hypothetical protein [Haemophilus parahaemolyticus]MDU4465519.1 hypothetical protein [Haemophilus parahaemolyticus]
MKKLLLVSVIGTLLTGCLSGTGWKPIEHTMINKFNEQQAKNQLKEGSSRIEGNAFLRQNGGGVVTCAGQEVTLIPFTEYANEKLKVSYLSEDKGYQDWVYGNYKFNNEDPNYVKYMKTAVCDSQGKFTFDKLSAGTYFVVTAVKWQVGYYLQGGSLMQKVTLAKGDTKNIVMSY